MMNIHAIAKKLKRPAISHKGDFGRVFVLAGSRGMTGAANLAGMSALRAGAGLVTVGVPDAVYLIIAKRDSELMIRPLPSTSKGTLSLQGFPEIRRFCHTQNVLAIGPGLSQHLTTQKLIRKVLQETETPVVIDADGLNALKGHLKILEGEKVPGPFVLTPHPGEFIRMFGGKLDGSDALRKDRAVKVARDYGVVVVLKGHRTVVASPSGEVYVNTTGNPGMATAGSGDVLTGVIAALIGQGLSCYEAACLGVHAHGLAGDIASGKIGQVGLVAGDLLRFLPDAFKILVG
ncbi:MAG TPA: NAD(P)H-hydrate dehydratase [Candidatus Omnitrophota bacterium]|nr:NAD(P)H-hydrate dehydratase [Candidatus Omnitrophota bacterium]HPS37418.1 NAD(P)H-hydrate dehydratase [Candidatus Omnitrophota bacterium]